MRVAGLDCSTTKSGISIMSDGNLEMCTLVDLHKEKDPDKRIRSMIKNIYDTLERYNLDSIYIEKAIMKGGNAKTIQQLSYLSGAVLMYCVQKDLEFFNPLPSEWRKQIGIAQNNKIKREVLKAEAIQAVKNEYGLDVGDDEAESILLARSAFNLPKLNITEDDLWD